VASKSSAETALRLRRRSTAAARFTNGNFIDLKDIAFNSATTLAFSQTSLTSGTLTVSGGGSTANILLLGQYTTAQFNKQSDGLGGTFITTTVTSAADLAAVVSSSHG
jgi:hypothetical protein